MSEEEKIKIYLMRDKAFLDEKVPFVPVIIENRSKYEFVVKNVEAENDDEKFVVDWSDLPKNAQGERVIPPYKKETVKVLWKPSSKDEGEVAIEDEEGNTVSYLDFGEVSEEQAEGYADIYIHNKSSNKFVITNVNSDADNLSFEIEEKTVEPNKRARIKVKWKFMENKPLKANLAVNGYFVKKQTPKIKIDGEFKIRVK